MGKTKKHKHKHSHKGKEKSYKTKNKAHKLKKTKNVNKNMPGSKSKLKSTERNKNVGDSFEIPIELMQNDKTYVPETPKEYEQRQKTIRREVDPITGRIRLIKGDGEILEEIVNKKKHAEINKTATKIDGKYFEDNALRKVSAYK